jgi:hypothetical protein
MKVKGTLIHPIDAGNFAVDRKLRVHACIAFDGARWEIVAVYGSRKGTRTREVCAWKIEGSPGGLPTGEKIAHSAPLAADSSERHAVRWDYLGFSRDARLPKNLR